MRPKMIVYFEVIMLSTLVLRAFKFMVEWEAWTRVAGVGFALAGVIFNIGLMAVLTLLISRRRSNIAMWASIVLFILGLPFFFISVLKGVFVASGLIPVLLVLGQGLAYRLLFTPTARAWMQSDSADAGQPSL